ncbi:MAG: DJ-1/PfpI family protein [Clostridiales bacterium]|nr:DJ-1/PfpI family protein [Clostridiales bacterium]
MMKVLIFFADGTEEVEALTPLDYLRRAGAEVLLVGVSGKVQTGSHGIKIETDVASSDLDENTAFDMIVFPGGMPGTLNIEACAKAQKLLARAVNENKFIAAICAAPMILGKAGILSGKNATCYPGFEKYLAGAKVSRGKAVRDDNIITATGAGAANEFAFELVGALCGDDAAKELAKSVRFTV